MISFAPKPYLVLSAIRDANLDLPAGKIEEGRYEVTLRAPAEYTRGAFPTSYSLPLMTDDDLLLRMSTS